MYRKPGLHHLITTTMIWAMCASAACAQGEKKSPSLLSNQSGNQLSLPPALKLKIPGPEIQNVMLGTWAIKAEYAPTKEAPNGGAGEGIEVWRPGPGGYSVIEEYHEKNARGEIYGFVTTPIAAPRGLQDSLTFRPPL